MARNSVARTSCVFDESLALICATVSVKRPLPTKMSVSSAKKQKISRAMSLFMSWRRSAVPQAGLSFNSSTYRRFRRLVARMSKAFSLIWRTVLMPASGRKNPK